MAAGGSNSGSGDGIPVDLNSVKMEVDDEAPATLPQPSDFQSMYLAQWLNLKTTIGQQQMAMMQQQQPVSQAGAQGEGSQQMTQLKQEEPQDMWMVNGQVAQMTLTEVKQESPMTMSLSDVKAEIGEDLNAMPNPATATMKNLGNAYLEFNPLLRSKATRVCSRLLQGNRVAPKSKQNIIFGTRCWKCLEYICFWTCQSCKKHFHKKCVFYGENYPVPIFNVTLEEAKNSTWDTTQLLRCVSCILGEETMIEELRNAPIQRLNKVFCNVAALVETTFEDVMREITPFEVTASPTLITNTAVNDTTFYKSFEGFTEHYQLILFQTIQRRGQQSEEAEAIQSMIKYLNVELSDAKHCLQCYGRRFDENVIGKLLLTPALYRTMETPCDMPHPIIWVKLEGFSGLYWPAKLLSTDEKQKKLKIHCFQERGYRTVQSDNAGTIYEFSEKDLNGRGRRRHSWKEAQADAMKYVKKLKEEFGDTEVIIPNQAVIFTDYCTSFKNMFPKKAQAMGYV